MILCACLEERYASKVCIKELAMSITADVTYDSRYQLNGWPWDVALDSSLMRWIDLKGFD